MGCSMDVSRRGWRAAVGGSRGWCRMRCLPLALVAALMLGVPAVASASSPASPQRGGKSVQFERQLSPAPDNSAFASSPLIATDGSPQISPISDPFSPRAHAAIAPALSAVLQLLAGGALGALGGIPGALELKKIDAELEGIKERLAALQTQVKAIHVLLATTNCNVVAGRLDNKEVRGATDATWDAYVGLAKAYNRTDANKKRVLDKIERLDPAATMQTIHNVLAKPSTQSLIEACGHAIQLKSEPFLMPQSSAEIQEILDFWRAYEGKLITLSVAEALWNTNKKPAKRVKCATTYLPPAVKPVCDGRKNHVAENKHLKPPIPPGTFLDLRSSLLWFQQPYLARNRQAAENVVAHKEPRNTWHLASSVGELFDLFRAPCCGGDTPKIWLHKRAGVDWSQVDHGNWGPTLHENLSYTRWGLYDHCSRRGPHWASRDELPLVWTTTQLNERAFSWSYWCDPQANGRNGRIPFKAERYGYAVPLGHDPYSLREDCEAKCAYPVRLPGAAFGVRRVEKSDYLYK